MDRAEILKQMITEKRRQIELYEAMIAEWEKEIGAPTAMSAAFRPPIASDGAAANGAKLEAGSEPSALVTNYEFHNKSQTEAARIVLERVGYPLTTAQIMEAVTKGGIVVGGKTPQAQKTNFYTILHRSKENFGLAAKDRWGLRGWKGIPKWEGKEENAPDAPKEDEAVQK